MDVYTLSEYVCRGSRICLQLSYPHGWTARRLDDPSSPELARDHPRLAEIGGTALDGGLRERRLSLAVE